MIATTVRADDDLPLTLPALLRARAGHGNRPLLTVDDESISYAEAERRSAALARGLLAAGVTKGAHVGVLHPNGPEFVVAAFAVARIGAVVVPISTLSTPHELATVLAQADVTCLLSAAGYRSHDYVSDIASCLGGFDPSQTPPLRATALPWLRQVFFDGADLPEHWTVAGLEARGAGVDDALLEAVEREVRPADRLVIVHTSGSTSRPKGVVHLHGPLLRHLNNLNEIRGFDEAEVFFSNSPFFWIGGFAYNLLGTLLGGAHLVCSNATDPVRTLDLLERVRPTLVNGFAAAAQRLADDPTFPGRDLSSIRRGNLYPIMPAHLRPADPELRHQLLGMTETGSVYLIDPDESDQPEHRRGSFGKPAPGFETRIVSLDGGEVLPEGQVGQLQVRSPLMMDGYYGILREEVFSPDGWFSTGDLARVDADGYHYYLGRTGDIIKTAGANVSAKEVEDAIMAITGCPAHVIGLPDETRGQIVAAMVARRDREVDVNALRVALRERLSAYKVPRVLSVVDELPLMSSGKIDRQAVQRQLSG